MQYFKMLAIALRSPGSIPGCAAKISIMAVYNIPIAWNSYVRIPVEADNLQAAVEAALKKFMTIPDDNYLSFSVDEIIMEETGESFDFDKATQTL